LITYRSGRYKWKHTILVTDIVIKKKNEKKEGKTREDNIVGAEGGKGGRVCG